MAEDAYIAGLQTRLQDSTNELDALRSDYENLAIENRQLRENLSALGDETVRVKHKLAALLKENKELRQGIVRIIGDEFDRRGKADDEP